MANELPRVSSELFRMPSEPSRMLSLPADFEVETSVLSHCAHAVADTATRVRTELRRCQPLDVPEPGMSAPGLPAPRWASAAAVAVLRDTTVRQFTCVADAIDRTSTAIATAAEQYEAADERAARRMRGLG